MASSENQGLQIAVIIFIMLVIALGVVSVMMFRMYTEAVTQSETDRAAAREADTNLRRAVDVESELKRLVGMGEEETVDAVTENFENDMKLVGARLQNLGDGLPQGPNYRTALQHIVSSLERIHSQLADKEVEIEQLKTTNAAFEQAKNQEIVQFEARAKKAEEDLAAARAKFNDDLRAKDDELAGLKSSVEEKAPAVTQVATERQQQVAQYDKEVDELKKVIDDQAKFIKEMTGEVFGGFDGTITRSNQPRGTVWIDRGSADYLRTQLPFSVYPAGATTIDGISPKAKIEITQILGPSLAEARIIEGDDLNPILPGDQIVAAVWSPGRQVRYAVAGRFDLNNDGRDDIETVKSLITAHGGGIDATLQADGNIDGQVYVGTTYLLLGAQPSERAKAGWDRMQQDAERYGVRMISLERFLDQIGYKADPRQLVQFGPLGNAGTVPPEQPDGGQRVSPGNYSDVFKQRRPPSAVGGTSAY